MSSTSMSALSASPIRRHRRNTLRVCSQSWLPLAAANILSARIFIFSTDDGLFAIPGALFGTERGSFVLPNLKRESNTEIGIKDIFEIGSINHEESLSSHKKPRRYPFSYEDSITFVKITSQLHRKGVSIFFSNGPIKRSLVLCPPD